MWVPNRPGLTASRTPSVHSVSSFHSNSRSISIASPQARSQSRGYESDPFSDTASEDDHATFRREHDGAVPPVWQTQRQESGSAVSALARKLEAVQPPRTTMISASQLQAHSRQQAQPTFRPVDDDVSSRSSTLDGNEEEIHYPTKPARTLSVKRRDSITNEPVSPVPAPHVPGPLESQFAALMSKLIYIEHANPAVSVQPEEYQEMQKRLTALEEEKKTWWKRHDAIWALRDEDVENNIKIRGMLAKCHRELEATKALRDGDLTNVQAVRSKLAEKSRELERLQAQTGRTSPNRGRPGSFFERRGTTDLFTAAKIAALEQRALELEKRNSDLVAQLENPRGGTNIDDMNRMVAHEAWKDTVASLESKLEAKDAELARLRGNGGSSTQTGPPMDWYKIEALLEEHASYRESVGGRLQALRSEKETLQKDLHHRENACQALELKVQTLQRRVNVL